MGGAVPVNLTFNAADHTYEMDGRPVPSVSRIIAPAKPWMREGAALEAARERGNAIHEFVEELNNGFEPDVPDDLAGYVDAYRGFMDAMMPDVLYSEIRVGHAGYQYAGTCDLVADIAGEVWVIDYKTGLTGPWDALQTAGYAAALVSMSRIKPQKGRYPLRATLSLSGDGKWKLIEHKDHAGDATTFLGLLSFYRWKEKNGL